MLKHLQFYSYLLIFTVLPALGSSSDQNHLGSCLQRSLTKHGFENVLAIVEDRRVIITYENRIYRDEIRAIQEAFTIAVRHVPQLEHITAIPQNREIPLVTVSIPKVTCRMPSGQAASDKCSVRSVEASLDVEDTWRRIASTTKQHSSFRKLDVIVRPQFNALFGNYDDPVESQINLVPAIRTGIWKGMSLFAELIIPLQNELGGDGDDLRPGLLTINQTFRLPRYTFVSATVGYFTENRYGVDFDAKKLLANGRLSVGANIGYTGRASYREGKWYISDLSAVTAIFNAEYRFPQYDLSVRGTFGRFLYEDDGVRFDVLRQFRETEIGFFVFKTDRGSNAGFKFSIPIFPPKYLPANRVRISPAREFQWGYRYRGIPFSGIRYNTGNETDAFMKRLNPDYIKNRLAGVEDFGFTQE